MISATDFYYDLIKSGRVRVSADPQPPAMLEEAVAQAYQLALAELAFEPPKLAPRAGCWAMLLLYRACQALVYREIPAPAVQEALAEPCPLAPSPEVCFSADLSLRFIVDLIKLSKGIAQDDPLVSELLALGRAWPLSSVGVAIEGDLDVEQFIHDKCLMRLYVDRVIERADVSRLKNPKVREAAREALGMHADLAPAIAAELNCPKQEEQK